ncbi:hypothetical protein [Carboxylicivirga sp. N1Y90]|uniref:hypothetical protein n=1 Tax=Carboxylicivirga fragile TaxID=3417571 RepID=UPI003D34E892|nr:hypothetical protein [Marinilabiliaceae bacterium N1Y90]
MSLLLVILCSFSPVASAKNLKGYIVTHSEDTIRGEVRVYLFNRMTGHANILGLDFESLHFEVSFKSNVSLRFKTYKPKQLKGFAFEHKSRKYVFHSRIIERKSMVRCEREEARFLQLLSNETVSLYVDLRRQYVNSAVKDWYGMSNSYMYREYYLYNSQLGLSEVMESRDEKQIENLLVIYGIEQAFIDTLEPKITFKDIRYILIQYHAWNVDRQLKSAQS